MLFSLLFAPVFSLEKSAQINYFVYLKTPNTRLRKGPGPKNSVSVILTTSRYPLKVIASYDHWRHVADLHGPLGWAHKAAFSNKKRFGLVTKSCTLTQKNTDKALANLPEGFIVELVHKVNNQWFVLAKDPIRKDAQILTGLVPCACVWGE